MGGRGSADLTKSRAKTAAVVTFLVSLAASVAAMGFGRALAWPDYVHIDFGMPFTWGTHVLNTFIGPVDKWQIDYGGLGLDLLIWGAIVLVLTLAAWQLAGRQSPPPATKTP